MGKNKVTFGFKNVHIAFMDDSTVIPTWSMPVKVPGAVRFAPTPEGDSSTFYADDGPYFVITTNNGYTGELEIALLPDLVVKEMLGWEVDNNGMLVETTDAQPRKFALMGEVQGDARNRRFVYYNVQAERPSKEKVTKGEGTEIVADVLNVTIAPVTLNGKSFVKGDLELSETNEAVFSSFFESVYTPQFTVAADGGQS